MKIDFIRSAFSEPDGNGSSSRILIAILIAFTLGVGIAFSTLVFSKRVTIDQFEGYMSSGANFIITTCGPLYGINKVSDAYKNRPGQNNQGQ
jgi:hypothetical protein